MRELAKDLQVSLITTKRAYEDLEKDGLLQQLEEKGPLLRSKIVLFLKEKQFLPLKNLVKELVNEAQAIEMSLEELQDILTFI